MHCLMQTVKEKRRHKCRSHQLEKKSRLTNSRSREKTAVKEELKKPLKIRSLSAESSDFSSRHEGVQSINGCYRLCIVCFALMRCTCSNCQACAVLWMASLKVDPAAWGKGLFGTKIAEERAHEDASDASCSRPRSSVGCGGTARRNCHGNACSSQLSYSNSFI